MDIIYIERKRRKHIICRQKAACEHHHTQQIELLGINKNTNVPLLFWTQKVSRKSDCEFVYYCYYYDDTKFMILHETLFSSSSSSSSSFWAWKWTSTAKKGLVQFGLLSICTWSCAIIFNEKLQIIIIFLLLSYYYYLDWTSINYYQIVFKLESI